MKSIACVASVGLLAVACTTQNKEAAPTSDTSAPSVPAPSAGTPATARTPPAGSPLKDSAKIIGKPTAKKTTSKAPTADSERDSATQALFELGADGKLHRVKK